MVRVRGGPAGIKKRRTLLSLTKGFRWGRKNKVRQAREAILHAGNHAFAHRRKKKGMFRRLWSVRLNAVLRQHDTSYSKFIHGLKQKDIQLNRKVLSEIATKKPEAFSKIVELTK